jgi:hypothetical protein
MRVEAEDYRWKKLLTDQMWRGSGLHGKLTGKLIDSLNLVYVLSDVKSQITRSKYSTAISSNLISTENLSTLYNRKHDAMAIA